MEGPLDRPVGELVEAARSASADPTSRRELLLNSRTMLHLAKVFGGDHEPARRQKVVRDDVHSEVYRLNGQRARDQARSRRFAHRSVAQPNSVRKGMWIERAG
jgi:hypothetical protein